MNNAHVWRAAQEHLRKKMKSAEFETWLRGTELVSLSMDGAILRTRTSFAQTMLEARYREDIETAIRDVVGYRCPLTIRVATYGEAPLPSAQQPPTQQHPRAAQSATVNRRTPQASAGSTDNGLARPSLFAADTANDVAPTEQQRVEVEQGTAPADDHAEADTSWQGDGAQREGSIRRLRLVTGDQRGRLGEASQRARLRSALNRIPTAPNSQSTSADGYDGSVGGVSALWGNVGGGGRSQPTPAQDSTTDGFATGNGTAPADPSAAALEGKAQMKHDSAEYADDAGYDDADESDSAYGDAAEDTGASRLSYAAGYSSGGPVYSGAESGAIPGVSPLTPPRLNSRYLFSTFIVGAGNRLAHAASLAVAEAPGHAYNPLFLYGGVGLGKTHLLHAIGHTALDRRLVVLYVSSETFTNEIINAIRYRTTDEFRAKYRSVDVLLVDDIQFIAGKDSTEEEFFHTFNSLYESNKQIVICSDRPPKAIVSLEERLRSRFEWGLIADIQPPDLETRVAILRAKADMMGRKTPDEVINFLATRVQSNIRELEGSLNRLLAYADLQGMPLTIETAKAALASLADDGRGRRVSISDILEAVAEHYHLSMDDLRGKQRDKHIVMPRQVAMYLMRQETEASLLEIGQALGGRDHSTVLHGWEKINREINENTALRKEITAILQDLQDS